MRNEKQLTRKEREREKVRESEREYTKITERNQEESLRNEKQLTRREREREREEREREYIILEADSRWIKRKSGKEKFKKLIC